MTRMHTKDIIISGAKFATKYVTSDLFENYKLKIHIITPEVFPLRNAWNGYYELLVLNQFMPECLLTKYLWD